MPEKTVPGSSHPPSSGRSSRDVSWTRRLLWVLLPLALALTAAWAQDRIPVIDLLREPKGDADIPAYTGAVSSLGFYLWAGSIAVAGMTVAVLWSSHVDRALRWCLAGGMAVSAGFLVDDRFLIHESLAPSYGIPEELVVVGHGLLSLTWLFVSRRVLARTDPLILGLALFLFATSMGIDQAPDSLVPVSYELEYFLEEGTKVLGIVTWFLFFLVVGIHALAPASSDGDRDDIPVT